MRRTSKGAGGLILFIIVVALVILWWRFSERLPQVLQNEPLPLLIATPDTSVAMTPTSPPALPFLEQAALPAPVDVLTAPSQTTASADAPPVPSLTTAVTVTPARAPPAYIDGLPVITLDELPPEALDTLALIERGGPFPFRQDGTTFQNRERLLPLKPAGYYREYTVITPGASMRGARRIVAGAGGELYYTDDHYANFRRIWKP